MAFHTVAKVGDIVTNEGRAFVVGKRIVAVFFDGTDYRAIDDTCPHMGASLAQGRFCDNSVTCGWHAWCFSLEDGTWIDNPRLQIDTFEILFFRSIIGIVIVSVAIAGRGLFHEINLRKLGTHLKRNVYLVIHCFGSLSSIHYLTL